MLTMHKGTLLLARLEIGLSNRDVVEIFSYKEIHLQSVHEIDRRFGRIDRNGNIDFKSSSTTSSIMYTASTRGQELTLIGQHPPILPKAERMTERFLISLSIDFP